MFDETNALPLFFILASVKIRSKNLLNSAMYGFKDVFWASTIDVSESKHISHDGASQAYR
jgi:hypothetical protein